MCTFEEYMAEKQIYLILFSEQDEDIREYEWLTDINSLKSIKVIVEYLSDNNYLSDEIKTRIYKYLEVSREIKTDNYNERVEVLNDIIRSLNKQLQDESYLFYICEFLKRRDAKMNKKIFYTIENYIDEMNVSLAFDYIFIKTHTSDTSDDEFINNYLEYFSLNAGFYYESLNAVCKEMPSIVDEIFKKRTKMVLDSIYKENKSIGIKSYNKRLVKKINKLI